MISCWLVDGRNRPTSIFSNNSQHNASISILRWNIHGKRLITGDKVRLTETFFIRVLNFRHEVPSSFINIDIDIDINQKLGGDCIRFETCLGTLFLITF